MAYDRLVRQAQPGLIYLVLDDSGSMAQTLAGATDARYLWVERYFGITFEELLCRSTEMKGDTAVIKPRYFVRVIRYGSHPESWGDGVMDIQAAAEKFTEEGGSLGLGGHLGGTDAHAALTLAGQELPGHVRGERFADSFPPMLLHMTDGESGTDATRAAQDIMKLATSDGNVLIVNAYIGAQTSLAYSGPDDFPGYISESEAGPSEDNLRLFRMSSPMPTCIHENLVNDQIFPNLRAGARLFFDVRTREMLKHVIQVVGSIGSRTGQ